jgi:hypothetical protein
VTVTIPQLKKDGTPFWCSLHAAPARDAVATQAEIDRCQPDDSPILRMLLHPCRHKTRLRHARRRHPMTP